MPLNNDPSKGKSGMCLGKDSFVVGSLVLKLLLSESTLLFF